ncbi:hypothetical protein PR003_g12024 [Phytophthora rubi]|uniref:Uncharacterized protein n=1 Tax=Phytophthora rubi TaxID=129364 RepID=A0A6A4FLI2_9STRA|nr:hypothetical protein PR002_g11467 [Phytophthora rubi]KAE9025966.1 hypothetical protein PR001_g12304 [Phytophthora rubi]KAE9337420.1 hypothetical protein PR003_g12024 [Phytophthora rubi]
MTSSAPARWKAPSADDEDDGGGGASPISDVFADMLNVNEDMIAAAAECQAEQDVEGLVAYQRILHRDLMEMADFIDSMFGVYSSSNSNDCRLVSTAATASTAQKKSPASEPRVVDLTTEPDETDAPSVATKKPGPAKKRPTKRAQRGALRTAIEAGEKVREIQRSKEQWIKSRHQVLEEEGASAIRSESSNGMLEVAVEKSRENAAQQGCGGVALANQLRAHQHIAAFVKASTEGTAVGLPPAPMNLLLASQLAIPTAAPLVIPAPLPPPPQMPTTGEQPIKPNTTGNNIAKIALPPAHSMLNLNVFFPFPGAPPLMFNPQAAGGLMPMAPWQMQATVPARPAMPVRPQAKAPEFKRMCESCRKRHFSVRQCRLVLQHTDPEWQQPAQPPPSSRRRKRKESDTNTDVT